MGRQIPEDRFFTDRGAGQTFDTNADLEQWVNAKLIDTGKSERVDFALEKLSLPLRRLTQYHDSDTRCALPHRLGHVGVLSSGL